MGAVSHVRFNIYPDGGVSRLRIFGRPVAPGRSTEGTRSRQSASSRTGEQGCLLDCCGSKAWVEQLLAQRPFANDAQLVRLRRTHLDAARSQGMAASISASPSDRQQRDQIEAVETARQWSAGEQSAATKSAPETLAVLAAANQAYQATFGYVFLICASGQKR